MTRLGSAIFPLSLMVVLAALTFWLRYATEMDEPRHDGKTRHDPDFIVSDGTLRKIDLSGNLKSTLSASEIRHYPDDDGSDLSDPKMVSYYPTRPSVTVTAKRAHSNKGGQQVDLYDDVEITRAASEKDEAMIGYTDMLTVLPDDEKAYTKSPVLITQGRSWVKGVGLKADTREQTYVIEAQAVASIESKSARKKP